MTNIVPLDKSRGFTRMDNQLMDGLLAIDLPAREMKIVLYVAKATINFGAGAIRAAHQLVNGDVVFQVRLICQLGAQIFEQTTT